MKNKHYLDIMKSIIKKRNISSKKVEKEILKLYTDVYKEYSEKLKNTNQDIISEAWLRAEMRALTEHMKEVSLIYGDIITKEMKDIIQEVSNVNEKYFNEASLKAGLVGDLFKNIFASSNSDVLKELMQGNLYKDRTGLSKRIWQDTKKFEKDIDYIIKKGLTEKKSIYDLAKDLEQYVNPKRKKDFDWEKLYPKVKKKVDYNAYRLANTSISHAYQTAQMRVAKQNPFINGIEWVGGNHSRSCNICKSRNGKIYSASIDSGKYTTEPLPLDHPNGFCNNIPVVEDLEEVARRLRNWVDEGTDSELDTWFKKYGQLYKSAKDVYQADNE